MPRGTKPVVTDQGIDFSTLQQVVNSELAADAKYDREDAAKFRAIAQKVATYDEFENIVKGSHLSPMKEDVANLELKRSAWSSSGRSETRAREKNLNPSKDATVKAPSTSSSHVQTEVKTSAAFGRRWKRGCPTQVDQYKLLLNLGPKKLAALFATEIPDGLLGAIIIAIDECFVPDDKSTLIAIMEMLPQTGRFSLAVEFMSDSEKKAGLNLIEKLPEIKETWSKLLK